MNPETKIFQPLSQIAEALYESMEQLFLEEFTGLSEAPRSNENHEYEIAIAEAISNLHLIGLDRKAIIKRLIDHL